MKKCIYCGREFQKLSNEHIIQQGLGGISKSEAICCDECNKTCVSELIDAPFVDIFKPFINRIKNFTKEYSSSSGSYEAFVECGGEKYKARIKNGKVVQCTEACRKLKTQVGSLHFNIICLNFSEGKDDFNRVYKNGFFKIGLNFALSNGVPYEAIQECIRVYKTDDVVTKIEFTNVMIPFFPLNIVDAYLEFKPCEELYHSLILFNTGCNLWCYINLFDTFKNYVLLSSKWEDSKNIYKTYAQKIEKPNRCQVNVGSLDPKTAHILSMQYGVIPSMDASVMEKRINEKIRLEPKEIDLFKYLSSKIGCDLSEGLSHEDCLNCLVNLHLYCDDDDNIQGDTFRRFWGNVEDGKKRIYSYPDTIMAMIGEEKLKAFTFNKFHRLERYIEGK